jgi:catechol 2,3-dioxygenase-like lactoylglutathione lyase family enzyme
MTNPDSAPGDEDPATFFKRIGRQISRRSFLSKSAAVGGGTLALSTSANSAMAHGDDHDGENGDDENGDDKMKTADEFTDLDILNFALTLEELEYAFYEEGLGWTRSNSEDEVAFYQLGGLVFALFSREALAADAGLDPRGEGFSGIALACNVRSREEVAMVLDEAVAAGGTLLRPAEDTFWGGHSGYFADPDGHLWEIAWNPHWTLAPDGAVQMG